MVTMEKIEDQSNLNKVKVMYLLLKAISQSIFEIFKICIYAME